MKFDMCKDCLYRSYVIEKYKTGQTKKSICLRTNQMLKYMRRCPEGYNAEQYEMFMLKCADYDLWAEAQEIKLREKYCTVVTK